MTLLAAPLRLERLALYFAVLFIVITSLVLVTMVFFRERLIDAVQRRTEDRLRGLNGRG